MPTIVEKTTPTAELYSKLRGCGLDTFVSVPCSLLAELIEILEHDPDIVYTPVTREEEGIGILAGAYLAGRRPVIVMQNSGYGNIVNAVCSLVTYYKMAIVMLISHRGSAGERIDAQVPMGEAVQSIMEASGVRCITVPSPGDLGLLDGAIATAYEDESPVGFLLPFSYWNARQ